MRKDDLFIINPCLYAKALTPTFKTLALVKNGCIKDLLRTGFLIKRIC